MDKYIVNKYTINKVIVKGKLFFAGGQPKFRLLPKLVRWGDIISIFWLGTELCFKLK